MFPVFVQKVRFLFLWAGLVFAFTIIIARLCYLHLVGPSVFEDYLHRNRKYFKTLPALRGMIIDRKKTILAIDHSYYEVGIDGKLWKGVSNENFLKLAQLFHLPIKELKERLANLKQERRWTKMAEKVAPADYEKIRQLKLSGLYGNKSSWREYPCGAAGAHVLGFMNRDKKASFGVELAMDFFLQGQDGWIDSEKDGKQRELFQFRKKRVEPFHGLTVQVTLDMVMQSIVEEEIGKIVKQYEPVGVSIIVSEASTGFLLVMANHPSFDPNHYNQVPLDALRNRSICDLYEPGSTFKIVTISAALNEGVAKEEDLFDCRSSKVKYNSEWLALPKDWTPFPVLSFVDVFRKSSNRGTAQIALRLGKERFYDYIKAFGYGESTKLGLVGEVEGILPAPARWSKTTLTRLPMGHNIAVTPLQTNMAMLVLANKGKRLKPQIISQILNSRNQVVFHAQPKIQRKVLEESTAQRVIDILTDLSEKQKIPGFSYVAKTGTAQKIVEGKYVHNKHVASISGFFPKKNPRWVITIVIDEPKFKGTAYGSIVAAPIFKSLVDKFLAYEKI